MLRNLSNPQDASGSETHSDANDLSTQSTTNMEEITETGLTIKLTQQRFEEEMRRRKELQEPPLGEVPYLPAAKDVAAELAKREPEELTDLSPEYFIEEDKRRGAFDIGNLEESSSTPSRSTSSPNVEQVESERLETII